MGTVRNIDIRNNILAHLLGGAVVRGTGAVAMDRVSIRNNIFQNTGSPDDLVVESGTPPTNYTAANNSRADPMFVSATDFRLRTGSPGIDSGVNVGRSFTGAAPDRGYAEN